MKKPGRENKIAVCVGTITEDVRIHKLPKLKVGMFHCCVRFLFSLVVIKIICCNI